MEEQSISQPSNLYMDIFNALDFNKIKDHPNILIAANFWDADRYEAAKVCYKLMRAVDDLIDNYKSAHLTISDGEKGRFTTEVETWIQSIVHQAKNDPNQKEILETFDKFCIPVWPMEAFAKSMIYDINHDGFKDLSTFLKYAEGASVAPAAIFVHLCGLTQKENTYSAPVFDVKKAATPCAVFSYLVHIIRDFQKDQFNNLNYLADDLVEKYGLDRKKLNAIAHGGVIEEGFRHLIREYCHVADQYRLKTYEAIQEISPLLEPRCRLSLEIIFNLYLMVFERIDPEKGTFTAEELNPTPEEVKTMVYETIQRFIHHSGISNA